MISERGLKLLIEFEDIRLQAYPDPGTGGEPWTIGAGHTGGVKPGDTCTIDEAMAWLREDCAEAEKAIDELVDVELTQPQRDALISFVFNVGEGNFRNSTLLRLVNAGNLEAASKQFMRWSHADGRVMAGLTRRRAAEAQLFTA